MQSISELVLFKNHHIIAFNKPPAMPVQPDQTGDSSLLSIASAYCKQTLFLVHRLDRPASGVVVFAKKPNIAAHLSQQFQHHTLVKSYLAVVQQKPTSEEGTLVHYLKKGAKVNKNLAFEEEQPDSQKASLHYEVLGSIENYHLLKIQLHTGRFHQIRAQLAAIGSPIKGDVKYGFKRSNDDRSIHLHAWKMEKLQPNPEGEPIKLLAPPPIKDPVWNAFQNIIIEK